MNDVNNVFMAYVARAEDAVPKNPDDFIGDDGLLYCGVCKKQKQCRPFKEHPEMVVSCVCECIIKEQARLKEEQRREEQARRREMCFKTPDKQNGDGDRTYKVKQEIDFTFNLDDSPHTEASRITRGYAEQFTPGTDWLLLCGTNGIGKSFYSACVCNELLSCGFRCRFTSISEIESDLWAAENKNGVYTDLAEHDLVVLDDFGAERDTEYMHEIQFNVLNTFLQLGTSCIITTNLSADELFNPKSKDMKRIFSRIYEKSIPVCCKGEDRRKKSMNESAREKIRRLMTSEKL
jgi:DNA replication protein DnaC